MDRSKAPKQRKAADTAASVQAFAGSILNKHRPGGGRSQYTSIPMLHAKPKGEQAAVQQRIHIHVTPPRAEDPRARRKPEERKTDRIIEREKVRVEHKTIIVREIVKIIDNQRTVRAQAMAAPVRLEASPHDRQSPVAATSMKQQASGSRREYPYSGTRPAATTLATGLHKGMGKLVRQSPFIERLRSIIASVEASTTPTSGRQAQRGKKDGGIVAAASYVAAKKAPLMHAKREETTKRETRAELSPKSRISNADLSARQANTTSQAAVNKAKRAKQKAERAEETLKRRTAEAADSVSKSLQSAKAAEDKVKETEQRAGRRETAAKRRATEAVEAANQAARSSQVATSKAKEAERRADHAEQVLQTKKTGTKRRKADSAVPEWQPVQSEELTGDKKQTAKRQQKRSDRNPQNNEAVSDRGEKFHTSGNSSTKKKGRRQTPNLVHKQSNSSAGPDQAITSSVQLQPVPDSKAGLQNPANKGSEGLRQQGTNASAARSGPSKTVANPNQNKFFAQRVLLTAGTSPIRLLSMSPSRVAASSINTRNNKSHRNNRLIRDWNPANPTNSSDSLPERAQSAGGSAKPPIQAKKLVHRQVEDADVASTESSPRKRNSPAFSPVEESSRTRLKALTGTEFRMDNAGPILLTALKHHRTSAGVNAGRRFPELLNARRRNSESGALNVSGTGSQKRPGSVSSQEREAAPVNSHGSASYEARRDRIGDQKQANLSSQLVTGRSRNNTAQPSAPLLVRRALKAGTSAELMEEGLKSPLTTGRIHRLFWNRDSAVRRIQRQQPSALENKSQTGFPRLSGPLVLRRNIANRDTEKKASAVSSPAVAPNRQEANRSHRTTGTTVAQASRSNDHETSPLHVPENAAPSRRANVQQRSGTDSRRHMPGQAAAYGPSGLVLRQLPETFGARMMRLAEQGHTGQTASSTSPMARGMLIGRRRPSLAPSVEKRSIIASAAQRSLAAAKHAELYKQGASPSLPKQGALVQRSAESSREDRRQHTARVVRPGKTALAESTREQGRTIAHVGPVISQPLTVAQRTSQKESARNSAPASSGLTIRESATISNSALGSAAIVQRAGSTGQDSVSASMSSRGRLSLTPAIARRTAESKRSPLIGRQFTASAIRGDHDRTVRQISSTNPGTFSSLAYNRPALNDAGLESQQPAFGASAHNGSPLGLTHRSAPQQPAEASRQIKVDAPRELEPEKLQRMIMKLPQLNPEAIADRVYKALERKMKLEQRRNGY
jgi:hypothetical protein